MSNHPAIAVIIGSQKEGKHAKIMQKQFGTA